MGTKAGLSLENAVNLLSSTQGKKTPYSEILGKNYHCYFNLWAIECFQKSQHDQFGQCGKNIIQNKAGGQEDKAFLSGGC